VAVSSTATAKNANAAHPQPSIATTTTADRRLIEYFVIITTVEKEKSSTNSTSNPNDSSTSGNNNGDISFSDWRTESSGNTSTQTSSDVGSNKKNYDSSSSHSINNNAALHDLYSSVSFQPLITARYPLHDHMDNPLHDNVIFFCHPSGNIHLRTEPYMPKVRVNGILGEVDNPIKSHLTRSSFFLFSYLVFVSLRIFLYRSIFLPLLVVQDDKYMVRV
jgi:hypothetical protein